MIQPIDINTNVITYNQFDNDNISFQEVLCNMMLPSTDTLTSLSIDFGNSTNKKVFQEKRSYDKNVPIKYESKRKEKHNSLYFYIILMFIILYIIL
jgi:hypothetical protein